MTSAGKFGTFLVAVIVATLLPSGGIPASSHGVSAHPTTGESGRRAVHISIPDFALTDQAGRPFRLQSLRGKIVLVTFVYTSCPDVCPLLTARMVLVQKDLQGKERRSVYFLGITTDPEIDRPQALQSYAGRYGVDFSNWSFLTGTAAELAPVWKSFGVQVQRKARGLVNHTPLTALLDKRGIMRFAYYGTSPDHRRILQDMRGLLASPEASGQGRTTGRPLVPSAVEIVPAWGEIRKFSGGRGQ